MPEIIDNCAVCNPDDTCVNVDHESDIDTVINNREWGLGATFVCLDTAAIYKINSQGVKVKFGG
ncbi:hypothetical protein FACS1894217_13230 [Clostridia bacterium]|nr:hypothetical protein FACS1894217_13230 [Clostridia bacterium]